MPIHRDFYPNHGDDRISWRTVMPGEHIAFRDLSQGKLGRMVLTECSQADSGGRVSLFISELLPIQADNLVIPVLEVEEGEAIIRIDEGEEFEMPVKSVKHGVGTVVFRHENYPRWDIHPAA